jgi:transglutaminase-like putative cysteine protease
MNGDVMQGSDANRNELDTLIATLGTVDHHGVDWPRVRWTAYLIHQHLRYDYPGPIHDLHQRLMIVPPERHGGQRLVTHKLEVAMPGQLPGQGPTPEESRDEFGNLALTLTVPEVERAIDFVAWIVVERDAVGDPALVTPETYANPAFREPSALTRPDDALRAAATELNSGDPTPDALAARINAWVHAQLTYEHGITGVRTAAAEALALRRGVCQDYAHIMLAICRLCGLPARYVSGHLLGEGGSHAWVEVLAPSPGNDGYVALPFDPTHGNRPGLNYITVAVGRDYGDVAPTSGTFRAPFAGQLSAQKRAGVTEIRYHPTEPAPALEPAF